jgi:hypothetical protein
MQDATITCPHCRGTIRLDETLAGPLVAETRSAFEAQIAAMQAAMAEREAAAARQMIEAAAARAEIDENVAMKVAEERARIAEDERKAARAEAATEVQALRLRDAEMAAKLTEAQAAQAAAMVRERALADREREMGLTIQKAIAEGAEAIRAKAQAEAVEGERLKLAEREKTIEDMKRQLDETRRKAEQGSQQLQGEVLELSLEAALQARFPHDRIEPVAKGTVGADIVQHVLTASGTACGTILWEVKRTKAWSPAWLPKLRDDQRATGATLAVLLSEALPADVTTFDLIDGIWVGHTRMGEALALVLRQSLVDVQATRIAQDGQATKTEMVYAYLTGPRFRQRIEAIAERFTDMQDDLRREMRATQRLWARRDQQIAAVVTATVGLYGDVQGIAGSAVADIPALDLAPPALEEDGGAGA